MGRVIMKSVLAVTVSALLLASASSGVAAPSPSEAQATDPAKPADGSAAPAALDPASLDLARQILAISFPPEKREHMMDSVMDSITEQTRTNVNSQLGGGDKDFEAILDRESDRMHAEMKKVMNSVLPDYFESFA